MSVIPEDNKSLTPPKLDNITEEEDAYADTGASGYYLAPKAPHEEATVQEPPISVGTPSGHRLRSSKACRLALKELPEEARKAHILPGLANKSLISIGTLCDAGLTAMFNRQCGDCQ